MKVEIENVQILIKVAALLGDDCVGIGITEKYIEFDGLTIWLEDKIFSYDMDNEDVIGDFKLFMALEGVRRECGFIYEEYSVSINEEEIDDDEA